METGKISFLFNFSLLSKMSILVCVLCSSCWPDKSKLIDIDGKPGWFFRVSTSYDWVEEIDGVYYEIIDDENRTIKGITSLLGTGYRQFRLDSCHSNSKDDIVFLYYYNSLLVCYDVRRKDEVYCDQVDSIIPYRRWNP